jgi:uncharacterized protein (DUF2267 family)
VPPRRVPTVTLDGISDVEPALTHEPGKNIERRRFMERVVWERKGRPRHWPVEQMRDAVIAAYHEHAGLMKVDKRTLESDWRDLKFRFFGLLSVTQPKRSY